MRGRSAPGAEELAKRIGWPHPDAATVNDHLTVGVVEHADFHRPERTGHDASEG